LRYILGIDQGGTKTAVALMDDTGAIRGWGTADGAYFPDVGLDAALSHVESLASRVLAEASVSLAEIGQVVAGITGIDYPDDEEKVCAALRKILGLERVEAHNDCVIALFSGTQKPYGAVLCAGTGANAAIIRPDGSRFVMSDYMGRELQGGAALSYRALRKVFDADLGLLPPTELTRLFLDFGGQPTVFALLRESIAHEESLRRRVLGLVPQIISLAETGDRVTAALLDEMARDLCAYFIAGLRKMGMLTLAFDIVLAGSVFKGEHNPLTANIIRRLSAEAPSATIVNAKYEPVVGACVMGFLRERDFTPQVSRRLELSAQQLGLLRTI